MKHVASLLGGSHLAAHHTRKPCGGCEKEQATTASLAALPPPGTPNARAERAGADALFWKLMWLYHSRRPQHDTVVGSDKVLIYFALGHQPDYLKLWELCMRSIVDQKVPSGLEFLVICDEKTSAALPLEVAGHRIHRHIVPALFSTQQASKAKVRICEWPRLEEFARIIFLDADILCTGPLDTICHGLSPQPGVLYSKAPRMQGPNPHVNIYHSLGAYREPDYFRLLTRKIQPFNCGQYLFLNSAVMRHHFRCVAELIEVWPHEQFFEQAAMNTYFNVLECADTSLLDPHILLTHPYEAESMSRDFTGQAFVHFAGPPGDANAKLTRIRSFYASRFQP